MKVNKMQKILVNGKSTAIEDFIGERILSDAQRKEFEGYILQKLEKKAIVQSTAQKGEQNEHIS